MKKFSSLIAFMILFTLNACSSDGNNDKNQTVLAEGQVNKLTTESFQQLIWDYKANPNEWVFHGDQPVIIDFYADWCRPCKMVAPILDDLSKEYKGKIRIYKVNTDEQRELSTLFNITSIPAVLFVPKSGKPQMSFGAMPREGFNDMITRVLMVK
jgi:thioredoxin 1